MVSKGYWIIRILLFLSLVFLVFLQIHWFLGDRWSTYIFDGNPFKDTSSASQNVTLSFLTIQTLKEDVF